MNGERQRAERRGLRAERLAAWWLRLRGYRVQARRFRCHGGEIDLVVRRGSTLVFVEVKHRTALEDAAYAVTPRQRQRIERAAAAYLGRSRGVEGCNVRFDAVLLAPGRWPRHLADAWRPE